MSALENVTIMLDRGDYEKLSTLPGGLDKHIGKAFMVFFEMQKRTFSIPFSPKRFADLPQFNRWAPSGGFRPKNCEVEVTACAALRSLGGSFEEQAFDAVRFYLTHPKLQKVD